MITVTSKYVGEGNAPQDVKRRRRQVHDLMRRMGQPVLVKHMYNAEDVEKGIAEPSINFDDVYGQSRNTDPISHGIGFVSVEKSTTEWTNGASIVTSRTAPGPTWVRPPQYRGFGEGYLLYVIQPDVAEDFFKVDETGTFIKIQSALVQAPWFPELNDNDLLINVALDNAGSIIETRERYQLKMVNPISMRGLDRRGRQEYSGDYGNRHIVNQQFEMALVPPNNVLYNVEVDR